MDGCIDKIIYDIETQRYYMRARYNIEPNKIVLGKKVCSILETEAVKWHNPERYSELSKSGIVGTVVGLPITIDYENPDTIEVCFELEEVERKFLGGYSLG